MSPLIAALTPYLAEAETRAPPSGPDAILASCDQIFARSLMGQPPFATSAGFDRHLNLLGSARLAGTRAEGGVRLSVHLTAYALASLNLAGEPFRSQAAALVRDQVWDWRLLIDPETLLPHWPARYAHHAWRVGHWVGGAPAILRLLRALAPEACAGLAAAPVAQVLEACDRLIDPRTGLLRTWRTPLLQTAFRQIYRLRHDPDAGAIGGVAHLHWINHVEGRTPYKAAVALYDRAWKLMQRRPFIEQAPYCLDFDVVQIVRTAASGPMPEAVRQRARDYAADITAFLTHAGPAYSLHRLPGALATLHECALISGETQASGLGAPAIDIIKEAGWL